MKTKLLAGFSFLALMFALSSSLEARHHHHSPSVQLQIGANFCGPQARCYTRERHIHHYHSVPQYVYVTPAPCYTEEVHVYKRSWWPW